MCRILCMFLFVILFTGYPSAVSAAGGYTQVSLGQRHSAALKSDGTVWVWGSGSDGQLGSTKAKAKQTTPLKVLSGAVSVSAGHFSTAAIKKDGTLWMWGNNRYGQLGTGDNTKRVKPVKVLNGVASVSASECCSAAVKKDGTLWMWGDNSYGQLGTGDLKARNKPVQVLTDVASVSVGGNRAAAVKKDGTLWMWGNNLDGALGTGDRTNRSKPVKVMTGVAQVQLGDMHIAAVKSNGTLWTWGNNDFGGLGTGNTSSQEKPVKIMSGVKSVSVGMWCSAAVKRDGTLWMWGLNADGQLGNGSRLDQSRPVKVLSGAASVSVGMYHVAAVMSDGELKLWGDNTYGQLGTGNTADQNMPASVSDPAKKNISSCKVKLSASSFVCTGKSITPEVVVTDGDAVLSPDTDYTLTILNNTAPGTAAVLIEGKGSYTGALNKSFQITLAAPKLKEALSGGYNAVKVSWEGSAGAQSYRLYYKGGTVKKWKLVKSGIKDTSYTHKADALLTGTKYTYTVRAESGGVLSSYDKTGKTAVPSLEQGRITGITSAAKGLKITWAKAEGADGYVLQRKDNGKWAVLKTIKKGTKVSVTDTAVQEGKTFRYRIRPYRTVNKKTVYGAYSAVQIGKL